jgi:hypothetical protein
MSLIVIIPLRSLRFRAPPPFGGSSWPKKTLLAVGLLLLILIRALAIDRGGMRLPAGLRLRLRPSGGGAYVFVSL